VVDSSFDQASRIDRLLHDPRVAQDLEGDETQDKPGSPDQQ
jgi:hypothetical protein